METIGEKIKRLRKSKGLSLMDLANKLEVSDTAISKIETGKTKSITVEMGENLCKELGVSFYELFDIETNNDEIREAKSLIDALYDQIDALEGRITEKDLMISVLINQNKLLKSYFMSGLFLDWKADVDRLEEKLKGNNEPDEKKNLELKLEELKSKFKGYCDYYISVGVLTPKEIDDFFIYNDNLLRAKN